MESKIRKVGKSENYKVDEEMRGQSEEKSSKSVIKAFARRNREKTRDIGRSGRKRTRHHML